MILLSAKKLIPDKDSFILGSLSLKKKPSLIEKKRLINVLFQMFPDMSFYSYDEEHNGKGPIRVIPIN